MHSRRVFSIFLLTTCLTFLGMVDAAATPGMAAQPRLAQNSTPTAYPLNSDWSPGGSNLLDFVVQPTAGNLPFPVDQTDILQITFPTPAPKPISAWRPPHYKVPWAAGPYDHFYFERPIAADQRNWPLEDYRYGGISEGSDVIHTGIDISAPIGTPILAAATGRVIWADYGLMTGRYNPNDPYGLAVAIRHDFGYLNQRLYTLYAHASELNVIDGQRVQAGDTIGWVGLTGATTGPHLHFEVRLGENTYTDTRNPELWLAPSQGWGVLAGSVLDTSGRPIVSQNIFVWTKDGVNNWTVRTYGFRSVNGDEYYQENLVVSDLPAGEYTVMVVYLGRRYYLDIEIFPGRISYFSFYGRLGFSLELPEPNSLQPFTPPSP